MGIYGNLWAFVEHCSRNLELCKGEKKSLKFFGFGRTNVLKHASSSDII
jgi:hypothetical protein